MYRMELSYGGVVAKTITPLTKKEAAECFYCHIQREDYGVRVYLNDQPMTYKQAVKHFGRPATTFCAEVADFERSDHD